MSPKLSFLDLPPEIRHAIYLDYVTVEKGYAFNFETGKLGALGSDGLIKPIHHALKFTCKTVAEEMMGLDFRVNTVNFSTGYSDRWRLSAAQFHHVQSYFSYASLSMLQRKPSNPEDDDADGDSDGDGDQRDGRESQDEGSDQDERREQDVGTGQDGDVHREINNDQIQDQGQWQDHDHDHDHDHDQHQDDDEHDDDDQDGNVDQGEDENEDENQAEQIFLTPCCTRAVVEEVAQRYPDFKPILEVALLGGDVTSDGSHFGLLPTFKRQAVLYTLELAIQHGTIPEDWYEHIFHSPRQLLALQKRFPPWLCCLPLYEIMDVTRHAPSTTFTKKLYPEYWEKPHLDGLGVRQYTQGKYRFSAAALAIRFLSRLPAHLRIHLRDIRLHEDSVSVAFPETHAQGLIKFCIENPKLHIERRLDLWRNVFQSPPNDEISLFTSALEDRWVTDTTDGERGPGLWSLVLTDKVALWIMEALALLPLGMPKESFTLVLDGGEAPGKCSEIFQQIVQRDAAWQAAWEIVAATEFSDHNYLTKRVHHCYRIDGFPEAMRDLENDPHGFIQCTFDLRPSIWHVEKETEKFRHLTVEQSHALPIDNQMFFQPPEPLPSWRDLLAENILPEFFGEQEIVKSEHNWEYLLDETDDDEEDNDEEDRWTEEIHEKFSKFMVKKENEEVERLAQGFAFFNLWDGYDSVFED